MLTARTGLDRRVSFRHGNALEMPYPDAGFDEAWTQHSSMNIADKGRLYAEIHRVLRPDGRLAMHEMLAGPVSPIHFPVPWARDPSLSHLRPPGEARALLRETGFEELAWIDEATPPCAGTRSGSRRRPENRRRSVPTSCSATTSARCSVTRCST